MLKNGEVHGVLGPQWSKEPTFVAELGARAHVPVISFTVKNRAFPHSQSPYFVRTTPDDIYQVKGLAAICKGFEWQEIVVLYEDTEYANLFISKLSESFQEVDIHLASMIAISASSKDSEIKDKLNKLMAKQTRVFLVHMNYLIGHRLFVLARRAGMMSKGYAWLISDSLSNFLTSVDSSSMENVVGIRPYVPKSKSLENFREKWKRNAVLMKPERSVMELNVYGLWAYDTIWALAMAIEEAMPLMPDFLNSSQGGNISEISNVPVSQLGQRILIELLNIKFTSLTGEFRLVDGHLQPSAFEIFNVIGTGERTVGYWSPDLGISEKVTSGVHQSYSTSTKVLRAIMWPGDTLVSPVGWAIPVTGKLKVGVPLKNGFHEFVNVQNDSLTQEYNYTGYCIDVFLAAVNQLPFQLDYEFVPYLDLHSPRNGSYQDMLDKIVNKTYDFVVGDVTILANRSKSVDFSQPYTESSIVMVLKNKKTIDMWIFLKPLRWDLWLAIAIACIFIGGVLGILEHHSNINDTGTLAQLEQQPRFFFFWLPIAVLAFPERNLVANKWAMFVLVIWLFVAYILMQSYTAKLSSIFTVEQLNFAFSTDYNVGYQRGSFVKNFLINELRLDENKLKNYTTIQEYHAAMTLGSKKGGIDAIFGESPYMRLLLNTYSSEYRIVGPTNKTGGFGFAFPKGSPLVIYFSRAILNVTQDPIIVGIEQKNFGPGYPSDLDSINQKNPSLTVYDFGGLFIILSIATIVALICTKTAVGRGFITMVSEYRFFKRPEPEPESEPVPSQLPSESNDNADNSATQGEIPQGDGSNSTTTNAVSSGEVELSELSNVDAASGAHQPEPNAAVDRPPGSSQS